jgi:hypothetical protein
MRPVSRAETGRIDCLFYTSPRWIQADHNFFLIDDWYNRAIGISDCVMFTEFTLVDEQQAREKHFFVFHCTSVICNSRPLIARQRSRENRSG